MTEESVPMGESRDFAGEGGLFVCVRNDFFIHSA